MKEKDLEECMDLIWVKSCLNTMYDGYTIVQQECIKKAIKLAYKKGKAERQKA